MTHTSFQLPPLDSLRAFEAAARAGSFSGAAEAANMTHGSISRQVAKLEQWLGLKLFERQARGVELTTDGQRLLERTREAFALIADTSDRWIEPRGTEVVRLTSLQSVCGLWLMPRLTQLETGNPALRIVLRVDGRMSDMEEDGMELAVRCGRGSVPGRVSVKLSEEWCYPVANPEMAAKIGDGDPERLLAYPLIHDSDASGWRAWFAAQGLDYQPRPKDRRFDDYNIVLDAAAHGLGIALSRPMLAEAALASGRVVQIDDRTALNPNSYWLDRPIRPLRPGAAALAERIGAAAGLNPAHMAVFLRNVR
ncbi:LysR family transcriptional regulator [Lacibacterium aquatile]|uniref:LysR family transcriptional regulator n=1 Tax=Lacibacterium aquatile TaxID=1168082 RepID=A0ABW5DZC8_9PROT